MIWFCFGTNPGKYDTLAMPRLVARARAARPARRRAGRVCEKNYLLIITYSLLLFHDFVTNAMYTFKRTSSTPPLSVRQ